MAEDNAHPRDRHALIKGVALGCFLFYLAWNVYWISQRRVPPSILLGVFGIAAPTTGMTRSMLALQNGHFREYLLWNPFALPVTVLFLASLGLFISNLICHRKAVLPKIMVWSWVVCLLLAWLVKLVQGPTWW